MNNFYHKNLVGGLNISVLPTTAYTNNQNYFSDTIIFGIKDQNNDTAIEVDSSTGTTNIPRLNYYVNAYTLSYSVNNTNVETDTNFIHAYSTYIFPVQDPDDFRYLSYHVAIMSYTLPTKHYVDKLLELKDALIYRGTLTPENTSGTNPGTFQATSVNGTEAGSMGFTYTTAGSVYKVSQTGYFGDIHVHAGDMIISYSDDATTNSITGWNVIEMHISHDNETSHTLNPQTGSENRVLTNIHIQHDGMLSYTYTHILENQITHDTTVSEINRQYVEYVDIEQDNTNNNILVTYHTKVLKFNNTGVQVDDRDTFGDTSYRFIANIHQDIDGHLTYTYVDIKTYSHHNTYCYNESPSTSTEPKYIINSIYLDDVGGLSYTYRDATILTSDISHTGDKDISNSNEASYGLAVITGIHVTPDGQLSYNWSYVYDPHDDHGTYTLDHPSKPAKEDVIGDKYIINNVYLNEDGWLSYTYRDATILNDNIRHASESDKDLSNINESGSGMKVITGIHMTPDGQLSYCWSYAYNPHDDHGTYTSEHPSKPADEDNSGYRYIINNVYLNEDGWLSYTYRDATISDSERKYNESGNTNIFNTESATKGMKVITGIDMTSDGQLSYTYSYIYDSHDSSSTGTETHVIKSSNNNDFIIINTYVNSAGVLSYTYMDIWGAL